MKKNLIIFSALLLSSAVKTNAQTLPITAASFPYTIIDGDSGRIEFFGKLTGFSGGIDGSGRGPAFFQITDEKTYKPCYESYVNMYYLQFNSNDGEGHGGLCFTASLDNACGTGSFGGWTYERIYGSNGEVNKWHCYSIKWNKNGLPELNRQQTVAVYIDGKQNTSAWGGVACPAFAPLSGGTFNLITVNHSPYSPLTGELIMDELRVYNGKGKLVLYNTLGSKEEIEKSVVGPNGSYNGFGDAHFVKGVKGYALSAHPVYGGGDPDLKVTANDASNALSGNKEFTINISPNPVTGNMLNLRIKNSGESNIQLSIADMQGRILVNQNLVLNSSSNKTIDVAALPKGIYILKIINNKNEQQQIKFVKAN
ncbi:T9SS type A sorting domain-containing protein [Panacibacter ginsenosidivorans]|uniref:T9SS type A sorting domain-containing protein n=1 Tax=Panacibacter ginsenosidivorans TaxID=1813871 RepID=A0A5B8VD33_9BACT|nr:T9SS type A sorting domain-containing protein [Panacibacter ginsenosidivorans]QEC69179.1 T9SS type A sorting domain-containing protein [Panacibacter ginsenosidivorans]